MGDAMVAATLSSSAQGCHCSTAELRQCGLKCFSKRGGARIDCITDCLDKLNHQHWCSRCYGRRSDCTMNKCLNKCASKPDSPKCTNCVHSKLEEIAAEVSQPMWLLFLRSRWFIIVLLRSLHAVQQS